MASDQGRVKELELKVGAHIEYDTGGKYPRKGHLRSQLKDPTCWRVVWEDGTTARIVLCSENRDTWTVISNPKSDSDSDGQAKDLENCLDGSTRTAEISGSKEESHIAASTKAAPQQEGDDKEQAKNSDGLPENDCSTSEAKESIDEQDEGGKRKEKMQRLARLYQRIGSLIGDKPSRNASEVQEQDSKQNDEKIAQKQESEECKEEDASDKGTSLSLKKSKAQELIARLKARTENTISNGPILKQVAPASIETPQYGSSHFSRSHGESLLQKRSRPESPTARFASHQDYRWTTTHFDGNRRANGEYASHPTSMPLYWKQNDLHSEMPGKRGRFEMDYDFPGSSQGVHGYSPVNGMGMKFMGSRELMKKERKNFPKETVDELKKWFEEHIMHPYPDDNDKDKLAEKTGLTTSQVSYWFVNARKRIWQPMLQDKQQSSLQGYAKVTAADVMLRGIFSEV